MIPSLKKKIKSLLVSMGAPLDRDVYIMKYINKNMKILEIGPSYNPTVPKTKGWNSFSVDHLPKAELIKKYHDISTDQIEEVDFIWQTGPINTSIPTEQHGTFDACIACHLIEHTPDFVSFFQSISKLLKKDGILSLAIPDKRYTFDYFQPLTLSDQMIQAYYEKRTRHTKATIFSGAAYNAYSNKRAAWGTLTNPTNVKLAGPDLFKSWEVTQNISSEDKDNYTDFHAWRFTPSSFRLIILELGALGLIPFSEISIHQISNGCEFVVNLINRKPNIDPLMLDKKRLGLMRKIIQEQNSQFNNYLFYNR